MNEVTVADILFILLVSGLIAAILYLVKRGKQEPATELERADVLSESESTESES